MDINQLLIHNLPMWVLIIIAILWAGEKFIFPFFAKFKDTEVSHGRLEEFKSELEELRNELKAWEVKYIALDHSYRSLQAKYNSVIGMLKGFQVYLREKGASDFPLMDELVRHADHDDK